MAVIQLSAIVTEIRGSIGGTAFKTQRGMQVMFKKSNGTSRSRLLKNPKLSYARNIFQRWQFLTTEQKSLWNYQANLWQFVNKYGVSVYLTGRQLFTKTNVVLGAGNYQEVPAEGFNTTTLDFNIQELQITPSVPEAIFSIVRQDGGLERYDVRFDASPRSLNEPIFSTAKVIQQVSLDHGDYVNFWTELIATYPELVAGWNVRVYVTPINIYGIKGVTQIAQAVAFG